MNRKGGKRGSPLKKITVWLVLSAMLLADPNLTSAMYMAEGPLSLPTPESELIPDSKIFTGTETGILPIPPKADEIEFEQVSDVIINSGNTVLLTLKAKSSTNKEITFSAAELPDGAALTGNRFQWKVGPNTAGEYKLVFNATDGVDTAEQTVSFYFMSTPGYGPEQGARPMILPDRQDGTGGNSKNVVIIIPTGGSTGSGSDSVSPLKDKTSDNLSDSEFRADDKNGGSNGGNVIIAPGTAAYRSGLGGLIPRTNTNSSQNNSASGGSEGDGSSSGSGDGGDNSNSNNNNDNNNNNGGNNPPNNDQPPAGDTVAPSFAGSNPAHGSEVNSLTQIVFTFSDNIGLDGSRTADTLSVTRDSAAFSSYSKNTSTPNQITLNISSNSTARHIYRFRITPIDMAGNQGTQADITITDLADVENDITAPTFVSSDPANGAEVNSLTQIRFTFNDNKDLDENATASTLNVTRDGVSFSDYSKNSSVTNQVSVSITNISTARHVYRFLIKPIDVSGNNGTQVDITITDLTDVHNTFQDMTALIQPAYVFGRGVAFMDYNNDNFEDLFIVNPFRDTNAHYSLPSTPVYKGENLLLRQQNDGTFVDQASPFADNAWMPGYSGTTPNAASRPQSIAFADYDNDGHRDFFITNSSGTNVLKRTVTDVGGTFLKFDDKNQELNGGASIGDSEGVVFADFNGDSFADIFVANGVNSNVLYVNHRGDPGNPANPNSFTNMAQVAGVESIGKSTVSAIAFDADNDGDSDLYLLYLNSANELYINDSTGFTPHFTLASGVMNHNGHSASAEVGDLDNDGYDDVLVCDLQGNSKLYRNDTSQNGVVFVDVTAGTALNTVLAATQPANKQVHSASFIDFDNDSDLDILLLRANAHNVLLKNPLDPPEGDPLVILGSRAFIDATSSELVALPNLGESVATSDFNSDGKTDFFISALPGANSKSILYQNVSENPNHFLKVKLQQSPAEGQTTPRDSTGALVLLEARGETGSPHAGNVVKQTRQLLGGRGRSQNSSVIHFGIADAIQPGDMSHAELDLTVFWPNSNRAPAFLSSTLGNFAIDNTIIVTEDAPNPFFVGMPEAGVDRDAAIDTEFFYILQVDDPDPTVDEQDLVVTVSNSGGTSINNTNVQQIPDQLGKWLFRFNASQPGFSLGQNVSLNFRVTNPVTHRFSDATLRVHVVSQSTANAVPLIDGIPSNEIVLDLAGANSEMTIPLIVTDPDHILAANPSLSMSVALNLQSGNPRPGASQIQLMGAGNVILSNEGKKLIQSIRWQPSPDDLVVGQETTGAVYTVSVTVDDFVTGDNRTPFTQTFNVRVKDSSTTNYAPFVWDETVFLAAVAAQMPLAIAENDVLDVDLNAFLTQGRDPVSYSVSLKSGSPVPTNVPAIASNHLRFTPSVNDGNQTFVFELSVSDSSTIESTEVNVSVEQVPVPAALILGPTNGTTLHTSDVLVTFNTPNWTVGGKGGTHIHFHMSGVNGYTSSDHFMFYNGTDNVVEFNSTPGPTIHATWATPNSLVFYNVPDGSHQLRAHLADQVHSSPSNPEATMTVTFTVDAGPDWSANEPANRQGTIGEPMTISLTDAIDPSSNQGHSPLMFSLVRVEDGVGADVTPFIDSYSIGLIDGKETFTYTPDIEDLVAGPALKFFFGVEDTINPIKISSGTIITLQHQLTLTMPAAESADAGFLYFIQLNPGEEITYSGNVADLNVTLTNSTAHDPDSYSFDQATDTLFYRPVPDDYFANRDNATPVTFTFNVSDGSQTKIGTLTISTITDNSGKYSNVIENLNGFTFDANQIFEHSLSSDPLRLNVEKWKLEMHSDGLSTHNGAGQGLVGAVGDVTGKTLVFDIRLAQTGTGIPILVGLKDQNNNEVNNINIETHPNVFIEDIVTSEPQSLKSDKYVRVKINTSAFSGVDLAHLDNWTVRIPDQGAGQTFTIYLDNMRFE